MALEEHDREDMMREATAMPCRGELRINESVVFLGLRAGNQLSIYFDGDPVWQFDSAGCLRRAFWNSLKVAAVQGRLVWLQSPDQGGQVRLQRMPLTDREQETLLQSASAGLQIVCQHLDEASPAVTAALPNAAIFLEKMRAAVRQIAVPVVVSGQGGVA